MLDFFLKKSENPVSNTQIIILSNANWLVVYTHKIVFSLFSIVYILGVKMSIILQTRFIS